MGEGDLPPDAQRCKRTDGRQWRCKRQAMDGMTLCEIHYLQGKHRQHKQKVPLSLKLERSVRKREENVNGECSKKILKKSKVQTLPLTEKRKGRCVSEALDDALKRMKLKRGDLQLDLIRIFLKRQVEKKKEKEKEKEMEMQENALEEETRELPNGVMAISQSSSSLQNLCENGSVDVKIGAETTGQCFLLRHFRSKSIEPMPVSTIKVVPYMEILKKKKLRKCHFCREGKYGCLVKCLACKKRFFCVECIKKRDLKKDEVKINCPVCCGLCRCKICLRQQLRAYNHGESCGDGRKLDRKSLLSYLIYMLLPVLKKVTQIRIL